MDNRGIFLVADIDREFLPHFAAIPLDLDMRWDFGILHRKPKSLAVQKYIEAAKKYYSAELEQYRKKYT